jgi:hypothetical protein
MTGTEFIAKWRKVTLTERSAAQQHFLDLCDPVGHAKPADVDKPERFSAYVSGLFQAMATGGDFLLRDIPHFNGSLFDSAVVIDLTADELHRVAAVADLDWSAIDPTIFGTLFVRGMDPALRSQLGAEYTSRTDIETLIEPVVMAPLRREWATVRAAVLATPMWTASSHCGRTASPGKRISAATGSRRRGPISSTAVVSGPVCWRPKASYRRLWWQHVEAATPG